MSDEVIIPKIDKTKINSKPDLGIIAEKQNVKKCITWFIFHRWPYIFKNVFDVNKVLFSIFAANIIYTD